MPDQYKLRSDLYVNAYRNFYKGEKEYFAKWEKGRNQPEWWSQWVHLSIVQAPKLWYQDPMNRADIEDLYGDDEPNLMFADGFDEAIAGVVWDGERTRVVYDTELILELLMGRSEMTYEEAVEYFDFNIAGSYMGEYTPFYLET